MSKVKASKAERFRADELDELSTRQKFCAMTILAEIAALRIQEDQLESGNQKHYAEELLYRRPHQHYLIHGPRGSGKTFLLLSMLGWLKSPDAIRDKLANEPKLKRHKSALRTLLDRQTSRPVVLKCIFPADTEVAGTVMDGIFAQISREIEVALKNAAAGDDKKRKDLTALQETLTKQIASSWTFDRNLGGEALLNDSANFADYAKQRAQKAWAGVHRIDEWRLFVGNFLDAIGAKQLIIGIDDTDVRPRLTIDTLESLRLYLDHPRIITIIAGNLPAMRKALLVDSFTQLGSAIHSVGHDAPTAKFWRRSQRREIEQYLEKVLPVIQRFNIGSFSERLDAVRLDEDFKKFAAGCGKAGIESFDAFCREHLRKGRADYFAAKRRAQLQYLERGHDLISKSSRNSQPSLSGPRPDSEFTSADYRALERYVAWWQLRHHYANELRPSDARQLKAFIHYFHFRHSTDKRLVVFLFESANNARMLHEMHDYETHVIDWLRRQEIKSQWVGQRYISINNRIYSPGTYSFEVLCYRIDVAMSMPLRFPVDSKLPRSLLPTAWGKDTAPAHKSVKDWRLSTYIVGAVISHASIPRNCRFMSDIRVLPDVAFVELEISVKEFWQAGKLKSYIEGIRHLFDLDEYTTRSLNTIAESEITLLPGMQDLDFRLDAHALLNDVRRAWAATLIYDYGMHNEQEFSSRTQDIAIRTTRPPSNRSLARYKLLTISELTEFTDDWPEFKAGCITSLEESDISNLRRSRHLLLYLCALSDSIPTLMLFGEADPKSQNRLEAWGPWIEKAQEFVRGFGEVLAGIHGHACTMVGEAAAGGGAQPMVCTPDISFVTLFGTKPRTGDVRAEQAVSRTPKTVLPSAAGESTPPAGTAAASGSEAQKVRRPPVLEVSGILKDVEDNLAIAQRVFEKLIGSRHASAGGAAEPTTAA